MRNNQKPLLFVDIDGVLSLFGFQSDTRPDGVWINVEGIVHLISASASEHLHRLAAPFDLVWCSGWEEKANEHLLGALVMPVALPFLTFTAQDGANARFFKPASRENHAMFDLPGYIKARLERAEIQGVEDLGLCTYAEPARFFSYRRTTHRGEPDYGRHVNAIALMK